MDKHKNDILETEQSIFIYVVNIASFLKSLKKNDIANKSTQKLADNAGKIHSTFIDISSKSNRKQILEEIQFYLEENQKILIEEFEEIDNQIIHEKANLLIDTNKLKKNIVFLQSFI